jgi:hypothetical protein
MRTYGFVLTAAIVFGGFAAAQHAPSVSTVHGGTMSAAANANMAAANTNAATTNTNTNTATNNNSTTTTTTNTPLTTTTTTTPGTATSVTSPAAGTNLQPPPALLTIPPAAQGVPPTPVPAFPGLPAPPTSPATPNTTGLPTEVTAQLRRQTELSAPIDVAQAQNLLAATGFFRGPIDGVLSGPTRSSIRAFQEATGLPATGLLDNQTAAALGINANAPFTNAPGVNFAVSPNTAPGATATAVAGTNAVTTTPTTPVPSPTMTGGVVTGPVVNNGRATPTTPVVERTPIGIIDNSRAPFPLSVPPPAAPFPESPIFIQP